jgi:hypothetical protein
MSSLDFGDAQVRDAYRSYIYSGLVACFALSRLFEDYNPDVLFLFSGRMSTTRIALEFAKRRGVRVICHERGLLRESLKLFENQHSLSLAPITQIWRDWGGVPLMREELSAIAGYMSGRDQGANVGEHTFSPPPQNVGELRAWLGLAESRPIWVLFTSSEDEVIATAERRGPFPDQLDWIRRTIAYARLHPELDLIIRVHPNIGGKKSIRKNLGQLQQFVDLRDSLPDNVKMVMPDDPISSYSLMDIATLGLVYISITGLEMACRGKYVVVGAGAWVRSLPFVQTVATGEEYESILGAMSHLPPMAESIQIQRLAYRFAYGLYFRWNIPFPLVKMVDPENGRLAYSTLDDLLPGREPSLDRICRIILHVDPATSSVNPPAA